MGAIQDNFNANYNGEAFNTNPTQSFTIGDLGNQTGETRNRTSVAIGVLEDQIETISDTHVKNKDLYSEGFILSGFDGEINGTIPNQFDLTTVGIAMLIQSDEDNNIEKREVSIDSFTTTTPNTTYYLDLNENGTLNWGTSNSTDVNYLSLWKLKTDGSGNIETAIDKRKFTYTFINSDIYEGEYDIVIVYGQSNTVGFAGQPGVPAIDNYATPTPYPTSLAYDIVTDSVIEISNTMNHLNYVDEGTSSRGNAWTAFANRYFKETGKGCVIVPAGRGGKTIAQLSKGAGSGETDYYQVLIDGYNSTKTAMINQNLTQGKTYVLYHQGESDQSAGTLHATYKAALEQLYSDLSTDIIDLDYMGVFIVGCPDSRAQESWTTIQEAQRDAINNTQGLFLLTDICTTFTEKNGQYNPADGTHYSQRGYNQMGEAGAKALANITISPKEEDEYNGNNNYILGSGWSKMKNISATAVLDSKIWYLGRRDYNGGLDNEGFFTDGIKDISFPVGGEIEFELAFIPTRIFSLNVEVSKGLSQFGIRASAEHLSGTNRIRISFSWDTTIVVNTSNGTILVGTPLGVPTADNLYDRAFSVTTDGTIATLTHPSSFDCPTATYYATSSVETGSVGIRNINDTSTQVSCSGANSVALVSFQNLSITRTIVGGASDGWININGIFGI